MKNRFKFDSNQTSLKNKDPSLVKDPPELTEEINKLIEKLYVYSKPTSSLILDYLQYVNQIDHLVSFRF